jgi:hypothetical protein
VLDREEHDVQLVAQDEVPLLLRRLLQRREPGGPGVRVEHVDPAVLLRGPVDPAADGVLVGQVHPMYAGGCV